MTEEIKRNRIVDAKTEWEDIPYTVRFVWTLSLLLIISSAAVWIRPENPSSNYILDVFGVQPTFVAFTLFVSGVLMPIAYKWKPNLNVILWIAFPSILIYVSLAMQVWSSATAPILHLVVYSGLIAFIVLCYILCQKQDISDEIILELTKEKLVNDKQNAENGG